MVEAVDFAPSRSLLSARGWRPRAVGAGGAVDAAWTRRFPMRRLMVVLAFAGVLAAPARASAMTDSQASKAVARKLASVYGSVWRTHTPSWSKPECRQVNVRHRFTCIVEFEHAGVWHHISASVTGGKVTLYRKSERHWVRQWRV